MPDAGCYAYHPSNVVLSIMLVIMHIMPKLFYALTLLSLFLSALAASTTLPEMPQKKPFEALHQAMLWHLEGEHGRETVQEKLLSTHTETDGTTAVRFQISASQGWFVVEGLRHFQTDARNQLTQVQVHLETPTVWNSPLRKLALQIPLDLHWRKRVFFQGDYELPWDTRYFYQFHLDTVGKLLDDPERNEWRYFSLRYLVPGQGLLQKAESLRTPFLRMQEAPAIPPFVQVYDEQGGYSALFDGLNQISPAGFQVDAAQQGALEWEWWSTAFPALQPGSSLSFSLFSQPRHLLLSYDQGNSALMARRAQLLQEWQYTALPEGDIGLYEQQWVADAAPSGEQLLTGGWPLRQGELQPNGKDKIVVQIAGSTVAAQTKPLAFWPDGSVKWLSVTAPFSSERITEAQTSQQTSSDKDSAPAKNASTPTPTAPFGPVTVNTAGKPNASIASPRRQSANPGRSAVVTLRSGESLPLSVNVLPSDQPVSASNAANSSKPNSTIQTIQQRGDWIVDNGALRITIGTGTHWLKSIQQQGNELLNTSHQGGLLHASFARDAELIGGSRFLDQGNLDYAEFNVKSIELVEQGPLRTQVLLKGEMAHREPTIVELYLTLHANQPFLDIQASAEFRFDNPRSTMLTQMAFDLPLQEQGPYQMTFAGQPVEEQNQIGRLLQLTPHSAWLEFDQAPTQFLQRSPGWAAISNSQHTIGVALRNFWQQAPSAFVFSAEQQLLRLELWPEAAGPMDVRRYSEYPHRSQGEGVGRGNDWVEEIYYPQHPFYGISRSREFRLMFLPTNSFDAAETYAADLESRPLLYAGWERYQDSGTSLQAPNPEQWPSAWQGWTQLAKFWLFHQQLHSWYGFWEYGDIQHQFHRGYGWVLEKSQLAQQMAKPVGQRQAYRSSPHRIIDYRPNNDWAFDNGRWGWTNTEGLPNLFLQNEYMRNGQRQVFFAAEAMARYSRDVVTRHSGRWFGAGTRHGVQPWSDGNHEPRQTTLTEWRPHYFLSGGETRSRRVFENLYNNAYNKNTYTVHAHHSAVLQGFLFQWELTGNPQDGERLKRYVHHFTSDKGVYIRPSVQFPQIIATQEPEELNSGNMFFHTFGAMHAMLDYYRLTQDPKVAQAFLAMGNSILADPSKREAIETGKHMEAVWGALALCIQATDNPQPFRNLLKGYFLSRGALMTYQPVTRNPRHWSGNSGYLAFSIPGIHFWNNWAPEVLSVLGPDELTSDTIRHEMQRIEQQGTPRNLNPLKWQSEYDQDPVIRQWLEPWWPK